MQAGGTNHGYQAVVELVSFSLKGQSVVEAVLELKKLFYANGRSMARS